MNIFKRFKKEEIKEKIKEVDLSFNELIEQVNQSISRVNEIDEPEVIEPIADSLLKIKSSIKALLSRGLSSDYNQALIISADNARKKISDQLLPLLDFKKPKTITGINDFITSINNFINTAERVINESKNAQIIFRDDLNNIIESLDEITELSEDLSESIIERKEQLDSFKSLFNEVNLLSEAINKLNSIKQAELDFRKKISSYERDKTFMSSELSRIKSIEGYNELNNIDQRLKSLDSRKIELEASANTIISKFSRVLRKAFKNDEFVNEFLTSPLNYICFNESSFNAKMKELIDLINSSRLGLNEKDSKRAINALSDDTINDYINEYKELINNEDRLKEKDLTLLKKAGVFEKRLIELTSKVNNNVKNLDSFKTLINNQLKEIEALKAKVEASASSCYDERVRITL